MRLRFVVGLAPLLPLVAPGCDAAPRAHIGLAMKEPEGLLAEATSVELSVFDQGSSRCESDGSVKDAPSASATSEFPLSKKGCAAGLTWCATLELDRDGKTKTFSVVAKNASGVLAEGCATATIDQDPLDVSITVKRYVEPGCCNDGKVQVGEQCDTGVVASTACDGSSGGRCRGIDADPVCDCSCRAQEILLSIDDEDDPGLKNGAAGSKTALALAFTPGTPTVDGALRAVFVDTNANAKGGSDLDERFLKPDLYPFTDDPPSLSETLLFPVLCAAVTDPSANGFVNHQDAPAIAAVGDQTAVVYLSDELQGGNFDVFLAPQSADGCDDAHSCSVDDDCETRSCLGAVCAASQQISISGTVPGASDPDIAAGPSGSALVVWSAGSSVFGRLWSNDGTLSPPETAILIAQNASAPKVAGYAGGYLVAYQGSGAGDGDGVFVRFVDPTGFVEGEVLVNAVTSGLQDQPDVAMLEDGRAIVVFHSGGDVWFQRYDANGLVLPNDQDAPLDTTPSADHAHPAVAASIGAGSFFAVAWETASDAGIAARFVGGSSGFGYNSVSGQNDDFSATYPGLDGQRSRPAVAVGGAGFVAIGWQDASPSHPGVFVRRFPLPEGL